MDFIKVKTSSPSGDLISFLAGLKELYWQTGKQISLLHQLNVNGNSYEGAVHPYSDSNDMPVLFNEYTFKMMAPLLMSQSYIGEYLQYAGQDVDLDMDKIRLEIFTNQPKGSLNRWFFYAFPQMATDLSRPWLEVDANMHKHIVINFTQRHRNPWVNYFFLKEMESKCFFVGLEKEHELFNKQYNLNIPYYKVQDFLELAEFIAGAKFFLGCQSFCFQLAEALKVPRILELFPLMPNVIPVGENAYDAYHQSAIEFYVKKLS